MHPPYVEASSYSRPHRDAMSRENVRRTFIASEKWRRKYAEIAYRVTSHALPVLLLYCATCTVSR